MKLSQINYMGRLCMYFIWKKRGNASSENENGKILFRMN